MYFHSDYDHNKQGRLDLSLGYVASLLSLEVKNDNLERKRAPLNL
jgi:hypothetical protein